jgi:hypothetical protein
LLSIGGLPIKWVVARAEVEAYLEKMPISARKRLSQPFRNFVTCGGKQLKSRTPQRRLDS